jgi:AcrR family transcriptional regulator
MSLREANKQRRRERILDAAEALIRRRGKLAFSMRELAERSGVSFATPFNLFGSKAGVLVALVERSLEEGFASLAETRGMDPVDRVFALGDRGVWAYSEDEALYRPLLRALVALSDDSPAPRLLEEATALWQEALRDGASAGLLRPELDVELIARQLHVNYRGAMMLWAFEEVDEQGWLLQVRHGVALVLLGVAADPLRPRLRARLAEIERALAASVRGEARSHELAARERTTHRASHPSSRR